MVKSKKTSVQQRAEAYEQKISEQPEKQHSHINFMKFASSIYKNRKNDEPDLSFKDMIKSDEFKERFKYIK